MNFSHEEYECNSYAGMLAMLSSFNSNLNAIDYKIFLITKTALFGDLPGKQESGLAVLTWLQCHSSCWLRRSFDSSNQECSCVSWQYSLEEGQIEDPSQIGSQTDRCIYNMPLKRSNLGWSINHCSCLLFHSTFFQVQQLST